MIICFLSASKDAGVIMIPLVLIVLFIAIIASLFKAPKDIKKKHESLDDENNEIEPEAVGAVVLTKRVDGGWAGNVNTPHYIEGYFVTFLTDDGDKREYRVGKETFDAIFEGQASTLVTVNGQFFAFDDGEDVEEEFQNE